ncbi:MAG: carbohydrate ABC transporter permease [Brevinematia bacterium]
MNKNNVFPRLIVHFILILGAIFIILPFCWVTTNSFKKPSELIAYPPSFLPKEPTLSNFTTIFRETPFITWLFNSIEFAILSTIAILITSALSGYILAKFKFPGRGIIFLTILATAIAPFEVYMISLYLIASKLCILNSMGGILLGYLVMSFGIFLIRQNVLASIPDELIEAARVDGASEWWIFFRVIVPLLRGPMGALAILAFLQAWTAFVWPLLVASSKNMYTLEVGLALFQTGFTVDYGKVSAGAFIAILIPTIFFLLMRRAFFESIALTGLRE